ncbi:LOW QUALITY PROTEIN: 11-beta-hydroxysteroid dehydrogenase type 2 [Lates calcarifer]|uniref:11-beta-hydroxysteroid dehydrogenase type 2 n=1 Tax=Lates calcarifer TaxID=8187 RepID=A0AAJ7VDK5_LATCA|nr:LOW QUALITY PROTEIN: 11-beta-hydroxysteroid dehydrogenase type 2 [Lates calcarifer]
MDDYTLPFWIYLGVLTVFVGGAMKKILASHLSTAPTLMAWLGATVLVERLWAFCLPAVLLLALLGFACCIYSAVRSSPPPATLPAHGKAVFITGCDSGFGNAAAKRLDTLGFEVFATVLDLSGDGAKELQRTCSPNLTLLQVDITQPQQVQQALLDTKAKLGLKGLWGLVNNAGVCVNFGDAELSLMSNYRGCMEVNFFGTLTVTKNFLPLLRQSKGRIVTISSPAGDQPFPCLAAYGASKAALNLFINTLRHELEPWGVRVSTILPSSYKTGQSSNHAYWEQQHKNLLQSLPPGLLEEYGEDYVTETKELFQSHACQANTDLSPVVNTIVQALLSPQPQARYFAGPGVGLMYFIHSYCPFSISNRFLQKLFVKKKLMPQALRKQSSFDLNLSLHNNNNNEEKLK